MDIICRNMAPYLIPPPTSSLTDRENNIDKPFFLFIEILKPL